VGLKDSIEMKRTEAKTHKVIEMAKRQARSYFLEKYTKIPP
jgi:hypothetical protein